MNCPKCGKENENENSFCRNCGNKLIETCAVESSVSSDVSATKKSMWVNNRKNAIIIFGVFIVLLSSSVVLSFFTNASNNSDYDEIIGKWEVKSGTINGIDYLQYTFNADKTFEWIIKNSGMEEVIYKGSYILAGSKAVVVKVSNGNSISNTILLKNDALMYDDVALVKVNKFSAKDTTTSDNKQINNETKTDSYSSKTGTPSNGSSITTDSGSSAMDDNAKSACWALAKKAVKSQLNSPDSAKFSSTYSNSDVSITNSGNKYTVISWVQAENGYSATEANSFFVTMTKSGTRSDAHYTVESCSIV